MQRQAKLQEHLVSTISGLLCERYRGSCIKVQVVDSTNLGFMRLPICFVVHVCWYHLSLAALDISTGSCHSNQERRLRTACVVKWWRLRDSGLCGELSGELLVEALGLRKHVMFGIRQPYYIFSFQQYFLFLIERLRLAKCGRVLFRVLGDSREAFPP